MGAWEVGLAAMASKIYSISLTLDRRFTLCWKMQVDFSPEELVEVWEAGSAVRRVVKEFVCVRKTRKIKLRRYYHMRKVETSTAGLPEGLVEAWEAGSVVEWEEESEAAWAGVF